MSNEFIPRSPDFKGDGIAIWTAKDKNGLTYLKVSVLGGKAVPCWKYVPKPVEKPRPSRDKTVDDVLDELNI